MHGLLGLELPEGDPYEFPQVPRAAAKAWITAALGKGSAVTRWAARGTKDNPDLLNFDANEVGRLICNRSRFLAGTGGSGRRRARPIGPYRAP
jgi:hypothetical protein